MKPVIISQHAKTRASQRGAAENEIYECIVESQHEHVEKSRLSARKIYSYNDLSPINNKFYQYKTVEVIFIEEAESITVITVKVFYSNRGEEL